MSNTADNVISRNLFGRRQIFSTVSNITADNIIEQVNNALSIHTLNLQEEEYLYWYRKGLQPVLHRQKEVRPEINNKIVENHAEEIVTFKNGYFLTKPAFYTSRLADDGEEEEDEENGIMKRLALANDYLYRSGKQEADNAVVDWFHTVGLGNLYVTPNDDEDVPVKAYALDPRNSFVAYSLAPGNEPVLGCNMVVIDGGLHVDAYTKDKVYRLSGETIGKFMTNDPTFIATVISIDAIEDNVLGEIPIIEYKYNSVRMGSFESAIPLMDALNTVMSNRVDGVEQFIQSLAIAVNCDLDEDVTANDIRQAGMIVLKSIGENKADFKILSEQLNQSETQVLVNYLYEQILAISAMPSSQKERYARAETGQAALAAGGWYEADSSARNTEDLFCSANKHFDRIFFKILKDKNLVDVKPSEVKLQFPRNETSNVQSKAQACHTMLSFGMAPALAFAKSGISNDPVTDVAQSEKYLKLVWGDPDAPVISPPIQEIPNNQIDTESMATEAGNEEGIQEPTHGETAQPNESEEPNVRAKQGLHWVNGYWKS